MHPWIPFAVIGVLAAGLIYFVASDSGGSGSLAPLFEALAAGAVLGAGFGAWVSAKVKA